MLGKRTKGLEQDPTTPSGGPGEGWAAHVSVICEDMRILGDCQVDGAIRILGKVSGTVRAQALDLAASGAVEGDVETVDGADADQRVVISGRVDGAVRARRVEVQEEGVILGGMVTDEATVQGRVEGGVVVRRRLALGATSVVEGDVDTRRLELREGGRVNGRIRMGDRAAIEDRGASRDGSATRLLVAGLSAAS